MTPTGYSSYQLTGSTEYLSDTYLRTKIKALDLEPIKFKLIKEYGWTLEQADQTEKIYKGFLLLNALYPSENHVPTRDIDEMWHAHILDTSKYMADCLEIFGEYLHHFPYLGLRGDADKKETEAIFELTRQRLVQEIGIDPLNAAADCGGGCGSSCGSSDSGGDSTPDSGGISVPFNDWSSSCSSSREESRDRKKDRKPSTPKPQPQPRQKGWFERILGLSANDGKWEDSVNPRSKMPAQRPGRAEILMMQDKAPADATHH